jgi:UDP-N-acetylmuramoyl-tripeptide--D-alanyl-D-alanine ligase
MDNSYLMSFSGLSHALGARLFSWEGKQKPGPMSRGFTSVSIDSRAVLPGGLFAALPGDSLDGHRFVDAAFRAGATGALVALSALEDPSLGLMSLAKNLNRVLIGAEDTLKAFQNAAAAYLRRFPKLLRIGITGSAGKTTTKEIAGAIIGQEKAVVMNRGNLNSETGLPLSIFEVRPHHEVGIFEAGMNRKEEMADLAKILNPHLALITNIGSAHIGILGSRGAIAEEKKKIFSEFSGNNTALIPASSDYRDFLAKDVRGRVVFYDTSSLPSLGGTRDMGIEGTEIIWEGEAARFGLPGKFNLQNALTAAALALELPVSAASIRRGFESVKPLFGRGEILKGRTTLIRDCYNSNPESAEAVLDFCDSLDWPGRKIYVMGSMLEQGDASVEVHAAIGKRLASSGADMVFLYGEEIRPAAFTLGEAAGKRLFFYTGDMGELSRALDDYVKAGDMVLLKGSRGCALEGLTGMLTGEGAREETCMFAEGRV